MQVFSSFFYGKLQLLYFRKGNVLEFRLLPAAQKTESIPDGEELESMIQFKPSRTPFGDAASVSLRNSPCIEGLNFVSQKKFDNKVITDFQYGEELFFHHIAELHDSFVRVWIEVENRTGKEQKFDQLCSFSLGMHTPSGSGRFFLERVTGRWHHEELSRERAGLERRCSLRFGENGTMPVSQYYPFAGLEDRKDGVLWGALLENSGAWMLEFSSFGENMSVSGGMPDRGFNGGILSVPAAGVYRIPPAVLSCVKGDILDLFNALQRSMSPQPESEVSPVYCGPFSEETLSFLKACGIRYYVLDSEGNAEDYPQITSAGLIPGVTLDVETYPADRQTAGVLTLEGKTLQTGDRVFADWRNSSRRTAAVQMLCARLKKHRIGYVRFVCPASFCCGCDGNASPQENQQEYIDSVFAFYAELRLEMPQLTLELCTCGIGRFSAKYLTLADVISSLETLPDPSGAMAALDRQMLARSCKCGARVTLHTGDELHGKLNTALLGRPILSGDLTHLRDAEKETLKQFLELYRTAQPVLRDGSGRLGHIIGDSCMAPSGWQVFYKNTETTLLIVLHIFSELPEKLSFDIPEKMHPVMDFSAKTVWRIQEQKLIVECSGNSGSAAFLFQKDHCISVI